MFILLGIVLFSSSGDGISFPGDGAAGGSEDVAAPPSFPCQVLSWGVHKLISQLNMLLTFIWTSCPCPNLTWSDFENVVGQDVSEELVQEITQHLFFLQVKSSWPIHTKCTLYHHHKSKNNIETSRWSSQSWTWRSTALPRPACSSPATRFRFWETSSPSQCWQSCKDKPANLPDVVLCAG